MLHIAIRALTASQGILEDLLKPQEFQDGQVYCRVESESSFVRAESGVELHPVATVDLDLTFVVLPCHTELDHTLWNGGDFQGFSVLWVLLEERRVFEC